MSLLSKIIAFFAILLSSNIANAANAALAWDYSSADQTLYEILEFSIERKVEACSGTGTFTQFATVPANARTFTDTSLQAGNTYCYRVRAVGANGISAPSNTVEKAVLVPIPPQNLRFQ